MGRLQDRRERPVVPSQHHGPGAGVAGLEIEDVVHRGATEGIDRLVVVADHRDVAVRLGQQRHELRLGPVRVLELVDQDVAEPTSDRGPRRRRLPHEPQRQRHLVTEVDEPAFGQQLLVAGVGPGELGLASSHLAERRTVVAGRGIDGRRLGPDPSRVGRVRRGRDVLVLASTEQRRERREEPGRIAQRPVLVEVEIVEVLAQEDHDLGPRQHPDVRREAELQRELADDPVAKRMERGDRRVRVAIRDELIDADGHLVGRLVREREGQDLRWPRTPRGDQPGDPPGDDLGLSGARPRDHEEWPIAVRDRAELVRVETTEQLIHPARSRCAGHGRIHDRHQVVPGRDLFERGRTAPPRADGGPGHRSGTGRSGWVGDGGHARTIVDRCDT